MKAYRYTAAQAADNERHAAAQVTLTIDALTTTLFVYVLQAYLSFGGLL